MAPPGGGTGPCTSKKKKRSTVGGSAVVQEDAELAIRVGLRGAGQEKKRIWETG